MSSRAGKVQHLLPIVDNKIIRSPNNSVIIQFNNLTALLIGDVKLENDTLQTLELTSTVSVSCWLTDRVLAN